MVHLYYRPYRLPNLARSSRYAALGYIIFADLTRPTSTYYTLYFPPKMATLAKKDALVQPDDIIYSDESSFSEEESVIANPEPPPMMPAVIANWWLNEKLGSGYSGV